MAKQAFSGVKRLGGLFSFDPHDLVIVTDPKDELWDPHTEEEIPDGAVLNVAAFGIINPVTVRRRGDQAVVIAGLQRTKRALVVNAIVGKRAYKGAIKAVHTAIKRMTTVPDSVEVAIRVMAVCPEGIKVPCTARNRGDNADARLVKIVENKWRRGADPVLVQADNAQRLLELGRTAEQVAEEMAVSVATVNRWRNVDLSKPREKKKRGKATRPGLKQVVAFRARIVDPTPREKALFAWFFGEEAAPEKLFEMKEEGA